MGKRGFSATRRLATGYFHMLVSGKAFAQTATNALLGSNSPHRHTSKLKNSRARTQLFSAAYVDLLYTMGKGQCKRFCAVKRLRESTCARSSIYAAQGKHPRKPGELLAKNHMSQIILFYFSSQIHYAVDSVFTLSRLQVLALAFKRIPRFALAIATEKAYYFNRYSGLLYSLEKD